MRDEHKIQNTILLKKLIVITIIMFFFGYALVPIYKKICDVTGVNIITKKELTDMISERPGEKLEKFDEPVGMAWF